MSDDPASTMGTLRRKRLDGALETIENVVFATDDYFKCLVVIIAANLTGGHWAPLVLQQFDSR